MKKSLTAVISAMILSTGFIATAHAVTYGSWKLDKSLSYTYQVGISSNNWRMVCVYTRDVYDVRNNKKVVIGEQRQSSNLPGKNLNSCFLM